ncbi:MAG: sulfatase [Myxococcota bacterium]
MLRAALSCVAAAAVACGGEPAGQRPQANVLLISIDTLRADHVGAYGYAQPTTPHIDALAEDSVRFEECVAHAPTTLASHASIFTSLLPRHHGASIARASRLTPGATSLAEILRDRGYSTASFNGGIQLDAAYGLGRGFDVYESARSHEATSRTLTGPEDRLRHGVDRTISWLRETRSPFFVFLHSYEIHHPYTPDDEFLAYFETDYAGDLPDRISVQLLEEINAGEHAIDAADAAHIVRSYDAELRSADAAVGRLLAFLREHDLYDDTLIVVTSDHGEEFGERDWYGWHGQTLFDEVLLVPLVIKLPESRLSGTVGRVQARGIDVAPTVLAALGVAPPASFAGGDLVAALDRPGGPPPPAVSTFDLPSDLPLWSARTGDWKLLWGDRFFDLADDPLEKTNVAAQKPGEFAKLKRDGHALLYDRAMPADVPAPLRHETVEQLRELGYIE